MVWSFPLLEPRLFRRLAAGGRCAAGRRGRTERLTTAAQELGFGRETTSPM